MAITVNSMTAENESPSEITSRFAINAVSADVTGNEELKAAPGAGLSLYIKHIEISCVAAITVVINAAASALLGPFNFAATSGSPISILFATPVKLAANTALNVDAGGAGVVQVCVQGYIGTG